MLMGGLTRIETSRASDARNAENEGAGTESWGRYTEYSPR